MITSVPLLEEARRTTSSQRPRRPSTSEALLGIAFCLPALAGLGVFVIFPLFQAVFLSTRGTDINGNPNRAVGGANFAAPPSRVVCCVPCVRPTTRLALRRMPVVLCARRG